MSGSVNKVILIGTLGQDPEMRYMPNGDAVANISLATDEGYKDKTTGQKVDKTEWHRVELFGKLAEIAGQYLQKGNKAYFEGKLKTDEYEKDGIKRYSTKIKAFSMTMLTPKSECGQPMQQAPHQEPQAAQTGYFFADGQAMAPHDAQYYIDRGVQPWVKGTPPPVVQ